MKASNQTIVDVRTPEEYNGGHVAGSINIPLQQIPTRLNEFTDLPQPLVLCCASGNRSGQAVAYLREQGITCENGGSWRSVNELVNQ
ncbi:rhodanese-like domain-containing protein [Spirosoma sp. HMF3257]|uniref:Rhodanese-like domain-containing protein n=1 Tax=Spirosoma telluris TaxID=2183553 RepID=A0A327NVQ0_9BACT|nr:rhodanese-like domain-containing protein [Spirosoma telluris]RAI78683.1 rhodanese-like domain-containing protein [Spirosoma telluris]